MEKDLDKMQYISEVILLTKTYNIQDFIDWMHYHLDVIKFDHCLVLDNESTVDIKSVCEKYGDRVEYIKVTGWARQYLLYNKYVNESNAFWVLPIDDDEYLWMKNFESVNEMLIHYNRKFPDMCKLSIRWKNMFPEDPLAERGEKSLQEFCTNSNENWANLFDGGNKPVKTFVKNTGAVLYNELSNETHNPIHLGAPSYMCNGERLRGNWYFGPDTDDDIKILHYQYKSAKEWVWKCRNRLALFGNRPFIYTKGQENIILSMK